AVGDDSRGGNTELLSRNGVVHTARRATTSICRASIPSCRRMGPLTMMNGALPPVLDDAPCKLYSGAHSAWTMATTTGMYVGRQPAMTALTATLPAEMRRWRT